MIEERETSIPPALVLAAQLVMGTLSGLLGLALASPLIGAMMIVIGAGDVPACWKTRTIRQNDQARGGRAAVRKRTSARACSTVMSPPFSTPAAQIAAPAA